MAHEENKQGRHQDNGLYSVKLRAGRRRTYFFDVRSTRNSDYYVTITESKKRFNEDGYDRHKIFLYKEDFNQFLDSLNNAVNHVKNDLLPEYDFDEFHRERENRKEEWAKQKPEAASMEPVAGTANESIPSTPETVNAETPIAEPIAAAETEVSNVEEAEPLKSRFMTESTGSDEKNGDGETEELQWD